MSEMGIPKNVIIFGAAVSIPCRPTAVQIGFSRRHLLFSCLFSFQLSCMEKCCRADISFQLLERMKIEKVAPNVHNYNSIISACARGNLWEKGYEMFLDMDKKGLAKDVVTYNAVLDAVCSQIRLARQLFQEGVKKGFYARVSRLGTQWFELDLHFLSLGGGEVALGWWFEECLLPYLEDTQKLSDVNSISIVTGYGKTRLRGRRHGDDGMRKRVKAMLRFMNIKELSQDNAGRIRVDKGALIEEVQRNGGKIKFDLDGYNAFKENETTEYDVPDVPQKIRARFRPQVLGSGRPPFIRVETESTSPEYLLENQKSHRLEEPDHRRRDEPPPGPGGPNQHVDRHYDRHRSEQGPGQEGPHRPDNRGGPQDRSGGQGAYDDRRNESAHHQDRPEGRGPRYGSEDGSTRSHRYGEDRNRSSARDYESIVPSSQGNGSADRFSRNGPPREDDRGRPPQDVRSGQADRFGPPRGDDRGRPPPESRLGRENRFGPQRDGRGGRFGHPRGDDRGRPAQEVMPGRDDRFGHPRGDDRGRPPQDAMPGRDDRFGPPRGDDRGRPPQEAMLGGDDRFGRPRGDDRGRPPQDAMPGRDNRFGRPRGDDRGRPPQEAMPGRDDRFGQPRGDDRDRPPQEAMPGRDDRFGPPRGDDRGDRFGPSRVDDRGRPPQDANRFGPPKGDDRGHPPHEEMERPGRFDHYGPSSGGNGGVGRNAGVKRDEYTDPQNSSRHGGYDGDRNIGVKQEEDRSTDPHARIQHQGHAEAYDLSRRGGYDADRNGGPRREEGGGGDQQGRSNQGDGGGRNVGIKREYEDYRSQQPNSRYGLERDSTRPRYD